jgi:16S rRNA G966 N2-methylase RsmD
VERRATILAGKALVTLERCPGGIVFLDPPYDQEDEYTGALGLLGEQPPVLTIAQHSIRRKLKDAYGGLHRTRLVKHGDNALSFYAAG